MTSKIFRNALSIAGSVAFAVVLTACGSSSDLKRPQEHLTAVVDAGSSGSRIYLYKTTPDESFVQIRQLFTSKDAPHGLSWYDGTQGADSAPGNAGASGIQPLLSALNTYMDSNGIAKHQVSVSVLATAGMRLVDADTARHYMLNLSYFNPSANALDGLAVPQEQVSAVRVGLAPQIARNPNYSLIR